jgi:AsmA protein
VEIPEDLIAPLKARGKFKLAKATLGNIVFENVELGVTTSGGKMRIFPVSSDLFGGAYQGDVRIDVAGSVPKLSMNEKIEGVNLAQLAKAMFDQDNVTGTVGGSFALAGSGKDMMAIQRDLAGNIALELKDGTYEGTDLWYELRRARALLKREEPPKPVLPAKTAFSTATVSGLVSGGIMKSDDLYAELPFMQLTGGGQIDLAQGTINYNMSARVLERPEFLKGATPAELDEFTEAVIPLKITGPLDSPKVAPDIEQLLKKKVEDELKDKLKDKLKGLFD